jgi:hypothetical protein
LKNAFGLWFKQLTVVEPQSKTAAQLQPTDDSDSDSEEIDDPEEVSNGAGGDLTPEEEEGDETVQAAVPVTEADFAPFRKECWIRHIHKAEGESGYRIRVRGDGNARSRRIQNRVLA